MTALKPSAATVADITDTSRIPMSLGGTTDRVFTGLGLKSYIGDALGNFSTAAQTPTAATLTKITGSDIAVPTGYQLRVGTQFRWELEVSKTAAGIAARSLFLKIGTLGTTADATILTFLQSSVPASATADVGRIRIIATVRAIGAAAGVIKGSMELTHNGNTAGLAAVPVHVVSPAASSTFNTTTAGLIVSLAVTTGASELLTIEQCLAEAKQL